MIILEQNPMQIENIITQPTINPLCEFFEQLGLEGGDLQSLDSEEIIHGRASQFDEPSPGFAP